MAHGLEKEQPETLFFIRKHLDRFGRVPTGPQLARDLGMTDSHAAYMRRKRLQDDGYLVKVDGKWTINDALVVTEPETATLLLHIQGQCEGNSTGKVSQDDILDWAHKCSISLADEGIVALLEQLSENQYLRTPSGWPKHYKVGPKFQAEYAWLMLISGNQAPKAKLHTREPRKSPDPKPRQSLRKKKRGL